MKEIQNIETLRRTVLATIPLVLRKKMSPVVAKEISNAAGKAIDSVKVELEYAAARKEKPAIAFLESGRRLALSR